MERGGLRGVMCDTFEGSIQNAPGMGQDMQVSLRLVFTDQARDRLF